ncbi:MAG: peptidase, partial [Litorivicinaceae bacterium]
WFNGYQKNLVASVWVGFDQPKTLGRAEYGGRAALPIWIEFMKHALKDIPQDAPSLPTGIVATRIDPETGAKARASQENALREFFLLENPPKEAAPEAMIPSTDGQTIQTPQQLF